MSNEQVMSHRRLTNAIRDHLDFATGGKDPSITGYVERLRQGHQAFTRPVGNYGGCSCGTVMCPVAVLIVHIDNLTAALAQSREQFAAETLRVDAALARVDTARRDAWQQGRDAAFAAVLHGGPAPIYDQPECADGVCNCGGCVV